jgi:hypothetical protein
VCARDAHALAKAIERLVNGEEMGRCDVEIGPFVTLANVVRGRAFDFR